MLSWDEQVKPALQPVMPSFTGEAPSPAPVAASPSSSTSSQRRVNAADKRIINGQTDVNQLVPFKYK